MKYRLFCMISTLAVCISASAQAPGRGAQPPAYVSPEVMPDRKIAFRVYAPKAEAVRVSGGDMPGLAQGGQDE